jgi:hypothetical protein
MLFSIALKVSILSTFLAKGSYGIDLDTNNAGKSITTLYSIP